MLWLNSKEASTSYSRRRDKHNSPATSQQMMSYYGVCRFERSIVTQPISYDSGKPNECLDDYTQTLTHTLTSHKRTPFASNYHLYPSSLFIAREQS